MNHSSISNKKSDEYKNLKNYLKKIKEILNIPIEVDKDLGKQKSFLSIIGEKDNNYVITNDNLKKWFY